MPRSRGAPILEGPFCALGVEAPLPWEDQAWRARRLNTSWAMVDKKRAIYNEPVHTEGSLGTSAQHMCTRKIACSVHQFGMCVQVGSVKGGGGLRHWTSLAGWLNLNTCNCHGQASEVTNSKDVRGVMLSHPSSSPQQLR